MYLSTTAVYDNKTCLAVFNIMCLKEYKLMFGLCFVIAYGVFPAIDLRNMTSLSINPILSPIHQTFIYDCNNNGPPSDVPGPP